MPHKHILVAVDFSKHCEQTIQLASELASNSHAKLSILHVIEPLPVSAYAYLGVVDLEDKMRADAIKTLKELGLKFKIPTTNQHIEIGHAKAVIVETAKKLNADLIVVGGHGHRRLLHLLGSTASAIANHADCDVFIVKHD